MTASVTHHPKSETTSWAVRLRMKHLLMLVALHRTASVRQAAQSMFMTQPAASKLLLDAEEIFGVRLFERGPKGLTITDSGLLIIERAAHLLNDLTHVREMASEAASGAVGIVRVGALPVVISTVVADAIIALHTRAPHLRIVLVESTGWQLLPALRRGEFDCVLGRMTERPAPDDLERVVLYREPVCVVARADHPLTSRRRLSLAKMAKWPWILPSDRTPLREFLEESWESSGINPPVCTLETVSVQAVVSVLRKSDYLAVMPISAASLFIESGILARIKIALSWTPPPIELMTLRQSHVQSPLRLFVEEIKKAASALA